jgi:hypothetical protein
MTEWLMYDVVLALLPVPLVFLGTWLIGTPRGLFAIIRDGQLCFYCTALGAVAIRDVTKVPRPGQSLAVSLGGIMFCLILSTFTYGVAVINATAPAPAVGIAQTDERRLGVTSVCVAITTTIIVAIVRKTMGLI